MRFKGKNILIVGASSGIGQALAKLLLQEEATLYTAGRTKPELPQSFHHFFYDVQDKSASLEALPDQVHGLVYCPGSIQLKPFTTLTTAAFLEDLELNVLGAIQVLQQCLKHFKRAESASVVLFSSVAAQQGMNYHTSIAMAKGALEGLGKSLAAEWSRHNIRVNLIAPSLTDTPLAAKLLSNEERRTASDQRHPLGRIGQPADIAHGAAYLLAEESSWVTGQVLHIDGGMSSLRLV